MDIEIESKFVLKRTSFNKSNFSREVRDKGRDRDGCKCKACTDRIKSSRGRGGKAGGAGRRSYPRVVALRFQLRDLFLSLQELLPTHVQLLGQHGKLLQRQLIRHSDTWS